MILKHISKTNKGKVIECSAKSLVAKTEFSWKQTHNSAMIVDTTNARDAKRSSDCFELNRFVRIDLQKATEAFRKCGRIGCIKQIMIF